MAFFDFGKKSAKQEKLVPDAMPNKAVSGRRDFLTKVVQGGAVTAIVGPEIFGTALLQSCTKKPDDIIPVTPPVVVPPTNSPLDDDTKAALKALKEAGITFDPPSKMRLLEGTKGDILSVQIDDLVAGASLTGMIGDKIKNLDLRVTNLHNTANIVLGEATGANYTLTAQNLIVDAIGKAGQAVLGGNGKIYITNSLQAGQGRTAPDNTAIPSMTLMAKDFVQFASADGQSAIANYARNSAFKINTSRFRAGFAQESVGLDVAAMDGAASEGNLFRLGTLPQGSSATYRANANNPAAGKVEIEDVGSKSTLDIIGTPAKPLDVSIQSLKSEVKANFTNANLTFATTGVSTSLGNDSKLHIDNSALTGKSQTMINQRIGDNVVLEITNSPQASAALTLSANATVGANTHISLTNSLTNSMQGGSSGAIIDIDNSALQKKSETTFNNQFDANVTLNLKTAPDTGSTLLFTDKAPIGPGSVVNVQNATPTFNAAISGGGAANILGATIKLDATDNRDLITANFNQPLGARQVSLSNANANFVNIGDYVTIKSIGKPGSYTYTNFNGGPVQGSSYIGSNSTINISGGQTAFNVDNIGANATHTIRGYLTSCKPKIGGSYNLNYHDDKADNILSFNTIADGSENHRNVVATNTPVTFVGGLGSYSTVQAGGPVAARLLNPYASASNNVIIEATGPDAAIRTTKNGDNCEFTVSGSSVTTPIGIDGGANATGKYSVVQDKKVDTVQPKDIPAANYSFPKNGACRG